MTRARAVITRCALNPHGLPGFIEGSPYWFPEDVDRLRAALRDDLSLMAVEPARKSFRTVPPDEPYPAPETCAPYVDANSLGFYLRPILPIVLVRTRRGEPLAEARVALKYLRENAGRFAPELARIAAHAATIFKPEVYDRLAPPLPRWATDVAQPYSTFAPGHLSLRTGLWIRTPPGVSTIIGPPINQRVPLRALTGAVETDWHHLELFVVVEYPEFDGPCLVIEPEHVLAQLHFAERAIHEQAELEFSRTDAGADPAYHAEWERLAARLVEQGRGTSAARAGVASVNIGCPTITRSGAGSIPRTRCCSASIEAPGRTPPMANREGDPPAWPSPVSHPVVVNTRHDTTGKLSLEAASPHAMGSSRELFSSALRRDVGVFTVERARSVFREVPRSGATIAPEICKPFVDANAFGVYL